MSTAAETDSSPRYPDPIQERNDTIDALGELFVRWRLATAVIYGEDGLGSKSILAGRVEADGLDGERDEWDPDIGTEVEVVKSYSEQDPYPRYAVALQSDASRMPDLRLLWGYAANPVEVHKGADAATATLDALVRHIVGEARFYKGRAETLLVKQLKNEGKPQRYLGFHAIGSTF